MVIVMSAPILLETEIVMTRRVGDVGRELVTEFLEAFAVSVIAFDDRQRQAAIEAFARYGKGRDPAGLNFGDCMSYAAAAAMSLPLLFVGNDFPRTDIEVA